MLRAAKLLALALLVLGQNSISCPLSESSFLFVNDLGCWKDTASRAIPALEGLEPELLVGSYSQRDDPVRRCALASIRRGYTTFAVQNGGWCASSPIANSTYKTHGKSTACQSDGEGGGWANQVYSVPPGHSKIKFKSLGCWKDTADRAVPTLEGKDLILDGSYPSRKEPFRKCYEAALRRGYTVFALQNGGWCASSAEAKDTYQKYGKSTGCPRDGEGGGWANEVYEILPC